MLRSKLSDDFSFAVECSPHESSRFPILSCVKLDNAGLRDEQLYNFVTSELGSESQQRRSLARNSVGISLSKKFSGCKSPIVQVNSFDVPPNFFNRGSGGYEVSSKNKWLAPR